MILKNELRIGNYVDYERTTHVVTRLLEYFVSHDWYKTIGKDDYDTSYDSINPIPLTPELLGKCGFKKRGVRYIDYIHEGLDELTLDPSYDNEYRLYVEAGEYTRVIADHIKHLHQLQNLYFALTGRELTINL
jgi:hypothetical protein